MEVILKTDHYTVYKNGGVYFLYKGDFKVLGFRCGWNDLVPFLCDCDKELEEKLSGNF